MKSYLESSLASDESIVYRGKVSFWLIYGLCAQIVFYLVALIVLNQFEFMHAGLKLSPAGYSTSLTLFGAATTFFTLAALRSSIRTLIYVFTTEIAVTSYRVIFKTGLIYRDTSEIRINRVEGANVSQGIIDRILNMGQVFVTGMGNNVLQIHYIDQPLSFRRALLERIPTETK